MIKDVIDAIKAAARKIFTNWGTSLILFLFYLLLLWVCYLFFTTGEATILQVFLSILILPIAGVVFFFIIQTMGLSYVRIGVGPLYLLQRAVKDFWKLCLVSLPLILLIWIVDYLFGLVQSAFFSESLVVGSPGRGYLRVVINWAELFLLFVVFPLIAIHLWISAISEGVAATLSPKGIISSLKRAFAPRSVLIYALLAIVFGTIAYFLFFTKTPLTGSWAELWAFGLRLAAALTVVFVGWLLTLGSMAESTARSLIGEPEA